MNFVTPLIINRETVFLVPGDDEQMLSLSQDLT